MDAKPLPDPEEYPKITIDGKTYDLKLTLAQVFEMEEETGIDFLSGTAQVFKGKDALKRSLTLACYALRHSGLTMTVDELMGKIELRHLKQVSEAIAETLTGKKTLEAPIETKPLDSGTVQ